MINRFFILFAVLGLMLVSACDRDYEKIRRDIQVGKKSYRIELFSGGKLVKYWDTKTIVNSSEKSDGYYFRDSDENLIEISGDVVITCMDCY